MILLRRYTLYDYKPHQQWMICCVINSNDYSCDETFDLITFDYFCIHDMNVLFIPSEKYRYSSYECPDHFRAKKTFTARVAKTSWYGWYLLNILLTCGLKHLIPLWNSCIAIFIQNSCIGVVFVFEEWFIWRGSCRKEDKMPWRFSGLPTLPISYLFRQEKLPGGIFHLQ